MTAYASLKDVASLARVSFQTAGKVLNGTPDVRVSPATARRIFAAAETLRYRPNALARSLLDRSTGTIGLLIADVTDAVSAKIAVGVQEEARRRGFAILLASLPAQDSHAVDTLRMLLERRVDGVILSPPQLEEDHEFAELVRCGVPAVALQHVIGGHVTFIGPDDRQAGQVATEHLLENGHRVIGTITGPYRRRAVRSRLLGYQDALREAGIHWNEDLIAEADWSAPGGARAIQILLEREPSMTAVFIHNDEMAIGALRELRSLGRRVPDDLAIVGCDDLPIAELLMPSLSSVNLPFTELGRKAVVALLKQVAGHPPGDEVVLPVSLSVRESSATGSRRTEISPMCENNNLQTA